MKKYLLLSLFLLNALYLLSQNTSLVVFSQDGDPFKLVVNGILYNDIPQTNVKIQGLNPTTYQATLMFENPEMGELSSNVNLREGKEMTHVVKKRKISDEEKLALVTFQNIARDFNLKEKSDVEAKKAEIEARNEVYSLKLFTEVEVEDKQLKVSPKVKEINKNLPVNEVTTVKDMEEVIIEEVAEEASDVEVEVHEDVAYQGKKGCELYIDQISFNKQLAEIKLINFDDQRHTEAEIMINNNCLSVSQIKEIMVLFTFDNPRLELAKLAYSNTYDQDNFAELYSLFSFESSVEELKAFVKGNN